MAEQNVNYICPSCNAPLRYDAVKSLLVCDYCGSEYTTELVESLMAQKIKDAQNGASGERVDSETEAGQTGGARQKPISGTKAATGDPIKDYLNSKRTLKEGEDGAMAVACSSCGATLIVSDVTAVTCCPYCGNTAIVPSQLGDTLEPDFIIPFSTTKEQAAEKLRQHYQGKICLPKVFAEQNHIEEIQGIYVPFWLYDGTCTGNAKWRCTNVRVFDDGEDTVTETDTWLVIRAGECDFKRIPADASKRMPNAHMDSIEPFDYSKMVEFSTSYLPGFAAERYDDGVSECAGRVTARAESTLMSGLEDSVGYYSTKIPFGSSAEHFLSNVSYALLPIWMLHTTWEGKDFLFAMNGQTTKLIGDLPVDKKKLAGLTALSFFVGFAATFLAVFGYLGGFQ